MSDDAAGDGPTGARPADSRSSSRGSIVAGVPIVAGAPIVGGGELSSVAAAVALGQSGAGAGAVESLGLFDLFVLAAVLLVMAVLVAVLFNRDQGLDLVPTIGFGLVFLGTVASTTLAALLWIRGLPLRIPVGAFWLGFPEGPPTPGFLSLLALFFAGYLIVSVGLFLDRRKLQQFYHRRMLSASAPPVARAPSMLWLYPLPLFGILFVADFALLVAGIDPAVPWGVVAAVPPTWFLAYAFTRSGLIESESAASSGSSPSDPTDSRLESGTDSSAGSHASNRADGPDERTRTDLRSELTAAVSTLNDARMAYDEGEYDEEWVLDACETASETAEDVLEAVQPVLDADDGDTDRGIEWLSRKAQDVISRAESLREDVHGEADAEDPPEELSSTIQAIEANLETAAKSRADREYDDALAAVETAIEAADDARTTADEHAPDRLEMIEVRLDEAERLRGEIETERDEYESAIDRLATLEDRLDAASDALDAGDTEAAHTRLDAIDDAIDGTADDAEEYGFDDVDRRIDALSSRCERLRDRAREAIASGTTVPDSIPAPPRRSLTYEEIEIGEPIGSGGNATVYRATATVDGTELDLALKRPQLSGTLHAETVDRMLEEAETWQRLDDHDHIVSVVDYGAEPLPWIAMEHMDAGDLGGRAGELSFEQALWTATAITKAIRHAHRAGVAHLDLKPENVLFRSVESGWDVPKVADWGLSRHLLKHPQSVEGLSPHYAAPEQFDDSYGGTDDITDVYQLGAVLYELFTGRRPFVGEPTQVMRAVLDEEPAPPSSYEPELPPALDAILLTALATEKADRYESVLYLRDELQELAPSV